MVHNENDHLYWINKGYDICVPGGTGNEGSNAAFGCFGFFDPHTETPCIITIPVFRKPFDSLREERDKNKMLLLGEDLQEPEEPRDIIAREAKEELSVYINIDRTYELANKAVTDTWDPNKIHRKSLFTCEGFNAHTMRRELSAKEPYLGIPLITPVHLLDEYLWDNHRWMLEYIKTYVKFRGEHFQPLLGRAATRSFRKTQKPQYARAS